jgi:hypothetical protein
MASNGVLAEKLATPTYNPAPTFGLPTYEEREQLNN